MWTFFFWTRTDNGILTTVHGRKTFGKCLSNVIKSFPPFKLACIYWSPAAAAKSLQSCPTVCSPIFGSPLGSSIHRIFQSWVLEWVAISFSILFLSISLLENDSVSAYHLSAFCFLLLIYKETMFDKVRQKLFNPIKFDKTSFWQWNSNNRI